MTVRALFSYNHKIGSYLIRAGSYLFDTSALTWANIPSHTALLVNDYWVIESVMHGGVRVVPYSNWKSINIQVASCPVTEFAENPTDLLTEIWGRSYDKLGLLYFVYAILRTKIFAKNMPVQNKFENDNKFFCVELVGRCLGIANYSTITPAELMAQLLENKS